MRSSLKAYPYPVLGRADDFTESEFQSTIDLRKQTGPDGESVTVDYTFLLSNSEILGLINDGKAAYAIDVRCSDTLFRQVFFCEKSGAIQFSVGQLYGKVIFEPIIVLKNAVSDFSADDINPEYQGVLFNLATGDVIAADEPQSRFIEFDKLRFESLVKVQTSDEVPDETYRFDLSGDIVVIMMGTKFRNLWDICREERDKAPFLAMSVYKDCIHAALDYIIQNKDEADEHKWARALKLKLSNIGRRIHEDSDFNDLCVHAQQLVSKLGVQRLLKNA